MKAPPSAFLAGIGVVDVPDTATIIKLRDEINGSTLQRHTRIDIVKPLLILLFICGPAHRWSLEDSGAQRPLDFIRALFQSRWNAQITKHEARRTKTRAERENSRSEPREDGVFSAENIN